MRTHTNPKLQLERSIYLHIDNNMEAISSSFQVQCLHDIVSLEDQLFSNYLSTF